MEITEHAIHLLAEMERSVHDHYGDFADLAHGFEHVQRVYHLALHLAEQEQADGLIVGMAALLHDLGRTTRGPAHSHLARSARLAKKMLADHDLPPQTLQAILHAIQAHGYRHGIEPATLEARVLYDADRLDSLGAGGVMRWAMNTKHGHWPEMRTYHPDDPFALWREPDGQRYLQELLHELAEGGSGYDMSEEVTYGLLWRKHSGEEQQKEQQAENPQPGRVVEMPGISEEQHSA
jgi:uncharacterized protein